MFHNSLLTDSQKVRRNFKDEKNTGTGISKIFPGLSFLVNEITGETQHKVSPVSNVPYYSEALESRANIAEDPPAIES